MEIFFVADQYVGEAGDLFEVPCEFFFPSAPERSSVIEVERNLRPMFLCGTGDLDAEFARLLGECGDEAGHVNDLRALISEDTLQVKVFDVQ